MLKVAFLIDSLDTGGVEMVLLNYIKGLSKYKHIELKVITNNKKETYLKGELLRYVPVLHLKPHELPLKIGFINKLYTSFVRKKNLQKHLKNIDVIVDFLDADFSKYIKNNKAKKITFIHSSYKKLLERKKGISQKIKHYDVITTICNDMQSEFSQMEPDLKQKSIMIYNPIDFNEIKKRSESLDLDCRTEIKLINENYILSVSRLDEATKDISSTLKAIKLLKEKGSLDFKFLILGDGQDSEQLKKLTADLNIQEHVYFLGEKSNPYVWMKHANLLVHSSKQEGFCLVLAEALSVKCDVIATDCPVGPREILKDGLYGDLCEVGNVEMLADMIAKRVFDNTKKSASFKSDIYSIESSSEHFANILEKVKNDIN